LLLKLRTSGSADVTDFYSTAGLSSDTGGGSPTAIYASPANSQAYWLIHGSSGNATGEYSHIVYTIWPRTGLNVSMIFQASGRPFSGSYTQYIGSGTIEGVTTVSGFKITTPAEGSYTLDITQWRVFGR
jgi:hypothetical protein